MTGLILPSNRPKGRNWVLCAAGDCGQWGRARPDWSAGAVYPKPPEGGWLFEDAVMPSSDGRLVETRLFVCSPSCHRRLRMRLVQPRLGKLDG